MSKDILIAFNVGFSNIKIGVFENVGDRPKRVGQGVVIFENAPSLTYVDEDGARRFEIANCSDSVELCAKTVAVLFEHVAQHDWRIGLVGHRAVHGGTAFDGPTLCSHQVVEQIEALTHLAPSHSRQTLATINAVARHCPSALQTVSFDTVFHKSQSSLAARLAVPKEMHEAGIRRYGFYGLSYKSVSTALHNIAPGVSSGRVICAHLGNGASLCGMVDGISVDTSMGFSLLDGVPMATRSGNIDPGVLLHLLRTSLPTVDLLEQFLYRSCGLLGVSGTSGDTRLLLGDFRPTAKEAVDLFCFRVAGEIGRLAVSIGGVDALVFTGGVGEHQPEIRKGIVRHLSWLGILLNETANRMNAPVLKAKESIVEILIIATDEEQVIADETLSVIARRGTRSERPDETS